MKSVKIGLSNESHPIVRAYVTKKFEVRENTLTFPGEPECSLVSRLSNEIAERQIITIALNALGEILPLKGLDYQALHEPPTALS